MDDRTGFNLMDSPKAFAQAFPALARTLHGRTLRFDPRRVVADCGSPYAKLLVNRP